MILAIHSDASYLSKAAARSQVGGHFFCSKDSENPHNNSAVHNVSKILKAVMSSAVKAELLGALYINARKAIPMHQLLKDMGHKQPKTPIETDSTAFGVVNNNIQPQRTKAMDMHFHWLR
jgi:hypothetical protein